MDVREQIAEQVERLQPELQEQVLRFVTSLSGLSQAGEKGTLLRRFAGSLDPLSARQMTQAIEKECEQVDAGEW